VFESFLKDLFIAYLEMDREIQNRIFEKKSKIEYVTLKELLENKKTLAEIEADTYTFQNLHSANLAYSNYCGINLFQIWNKRKKIGKRFFNILKLLEELLQLRHRIVHTAYLQLDFNREHVEFFRKGISHAGKLIVDAFEKKKLRIDLEKYL
jgi:hypothetical protein